VGYVQYIAYIITQICTSKFLTYW